MNLYIITEGDRTEMSVYPAWLSFAAPSLKRIEDARDVNSDNYYLISGHGIPSIYDHIVHAIEDVNSINKHNKGNGYDYLVVSIDVEDESREHILEIISQRLKEENIESSLAELVVLEQKVCIETWLLGNRAIFKENPQNTELAELIKHYDVKQKDPEDLQNLQPDRYSTKAQFHHHYLKLLFQERHMRYSKSNPQEVCKESYFNQLVRRNHETGQIPSFGRWLRFVTKNK